MDTHIETVSSEWLTIRASGRVRVQKGQFMRVFLQIAPLPLLAIGAGILVWRGMKTKPDGTNNAETSSSISE